MKNMISVFLFSLLSVSLYGASNLSMVTYFPTPYMAYQDLDVEKNCSVGLINGCNLETGKLTVSNTLTLQQGQLDLRGGNITVSNFTFGNTTNNNVMGRVTFNEDLQIKATSSNGLSNIKTTSRATLNGLKLGDYDFPTCSATNHQIAWKELTLDGVKGDFLVCGEASSGNNNPKNCSEATNGAFPSGSYNPNGNDISGCYKETYVWMSCNDYRMCGDWMGGQAGADRRDYADGGDPQYIWDDYTGCYPLAYNVQSTTPNDSSCDEPGSHYGDYNMNGNCSGYSGEMYLQDAACKREGAICTACHESSRKVYVCGRSSHDTPETGYSSHQYEILDKYNTCKGYR